MCVRSLFVSICVLLSIQVLSQGGKAFLKEGDALRKQNQLEKALERYELAVKVDPKLTKAWQAKAEVNQLLGRMEEAARDRRTLAQLDPGEPAFSTEAAKIYLEIDSPQVAMALLDQALRVDPKFMEALLTRTRACLQLNDVDGAVRNADAALALKATTDSYYAHALARTASGDLKTAEFDLEKVLEWNHLYEPAYVALADVQLGLYDQYSGGTMRMRTLEKAIEKCTRALELNPASTDALFARSKAYALQKEYSKAIDDVSKCIALDRHDVQIYHQRAKYYHGFGQHQNAVNDLNRALLDAPTDPDLLILRSECREANLDMEGALSDRDLARKYLEGSDRYTEEARREMEIARERIGKRIYEMNREEDAPLITVLEPFSLNEVAQISSSIDNVKVSGHVRDKSLLRSVVVNGTAAEFSKDEKDPQFTVSIPFDRADSTILVQAMDVYENMSSVELKVVRTEGIAPAVKITSPKPSGDRELTIAAGKDDLFIEGVITDASLIRAITVNGVNASYAPDKVDPDFSIRTNVKDLDRIVIRAEDQFGNATEAAYDLVRKAEAVASRPSASTPVGTTGITWVIQIENTNYRNFPPVQNGSDAQKMQKTFSSYNVQRTITKKNLTKEQMDRFFNIELRDLVRTNKVNTILVWYNGHGRSIGSKTYWLPVDAKKDDIYSYYNYGSLRQQLENYSGTVNSTLVISDATGADPSFYELTR